MRQRSNARIQTKISLQRDNERLKDNLSKMRELFIYIADKTGLDRKELSPVQVIIEIEKMLAEGGFIK